jgi:TonB family protein
LPSPSAEPTQPAAAAAKPVAPPEPIAVPQQSEPARAEPQQQKEPQPRPREDAEAKAQERAAAKKQAEAKKREEMRAASPAAMAQERAAALERSARAPALSQLASAPGSDLAGYRNAVLGHLAAYKHYPETARARGAHGEAVVDFTLDNVGRVVSAGISRSSGQADIDAETLAMVRRADPFPAPPPAAQRSFSAAIEFHLE